VSPIGLGDLARLLEIRRDRVARWVRLGYLRPDGTGRGPGRYVRFDTLEIRIAQRVARVSRRLGVDVTATLFARARRALEGEGTHGRNGHTGNPR
jgi:hypothetical protein